MADEVQETIEIKPQEGRQTQFLASPADITVYGGAAGGGKSYGMILDPLRHVITTPGYNAVIIRQTFSRIIKAGGLWDTALEVYPKTGALARVGDMRFDWKRSGGGRVEFGHVSHEDAVQAYQGSQITALLIDEATEISEKSFWFLVSRNRSTSGVKPYIKLTCNPDPNSFIADMVDWYIAEDGYADLARVGSIRYFVRTGAELDWGNSRQELLDKYSEIYNVPNEELTAKGVIPKSFTFIPATVFDNKILLEADPGYLANLNALLPVERERFLGDSLRGGNWKITPDAGDFFNENWFTIRDKITTNGIAVRFWDFAATEEEDGKKLPSSTASVLMLLQNDSYTVIDSMDGMWGAGDVEDIFLNTTESDAQWCQNYNFDYYSRWEEEPGSSSKRETSRLMEILARKGIDGDGKRSDKNKYIRARASAIATRAGLIKLYSAKWNKRVILHLHNQPMEKQDIMDAYAGAYNFLAGMDENAPLEMGMIDIVSTYRG